MRHVVLVVLWAIGLTGQGCSLARTNFDASVEDSLEHDVSRRIEIERDDADRVVPCNVVHRPDAGTREVIWRARFEKGFCRRKADESRLLLESRGWACQAEQPENRSNSSQPARGPTVFRAWRCEPGIAPTKVAHDPVPPVKPGKEQGQNDRPDQSTLWAVVEQDLAAIGRPMADPATSSTAAQGDLDADGQSDAIVVLTRKLDPQRSDRMVMAYLRHGETYSLVDVEISIIDQKPESDGLAVDIEDGIVRLRGCCNDAAGPATLVLRDRKLTRDNDIGQQF